MKIRTASLGDAPLISSLATRSKAYWGYPDEFMQACQDELKVSDED